MIEFWHWAVCFTIVVLVALPLFTTIGNLRIFYKATEADNKSENLDLISVLIPARNEATSIAAAVQSILINRYHQIEVLVLNDHSTDKTAAIVGKIACCDSRVRLLESTQLPSGWNGKQFACWQLAQASVGKHLLFLDADVRLTPDAIERIAVTARRSSLDLLSGFPRQQTGSFAERMLIPMMYVVLLGYLPLRQARSNNSPSLAAGCGQLFFAERAAYFEIDGHRSIAHSRHDGIQLPRSFRRGGKTTDLFDASDIAQCRMYEDLSSVQNGLLKNATEGIASVPLIFIFTVLLIGGFVMPLAMLAHAIYWQWSTAQMATLSIAAIAAFIPRCCIASSVGSSWMGVVLHPVAVLWFVALQWIAFFRSQFGIKTIWRGRES